MGLGDAEPGSVATTRSGPRTRDERTQPPVAGFERLTERGLRLLVSLGLTPASWPGSACGTVILEVKGRRTGRERSALVTWVEHEGVRYLVSMPGPEPAWVTNVRAAGGEAVLRRGRRRIRVRLEELPARGRAPILQAWYRWTARSPVPRRYFRLERRAPLECFERIAGEHPVFRIVVAGEPVAHGSRARPHVTRDVDPAALRVLLDDPPRATVAFVAGDGVELLPVRACVRDGVHLFGVRGDADADLGGQEVVLVVDGGAYWFQLRGLSVRGEARPVVSPPTAEGTSLRWYAVAPRRVLAWDYSTIREE